MTSERVPVAVVGAGNMGINHVRVYDELPDAELVEVIEPDPERASEVRENYDVKIRESVADIEDAEAATVAVPNKYHRDVATDLIERGLDVLVEKPLAMNVPDAEAIVETAKANDAVLQVGHIERFNPAIQAVSDILSGEDLISIDAQRLGPFNEHLVDESVIFDLMIHDLDVITTLVGSQPVSLNAMGAAVRSETFDHVNAQLQFPDDTIGSLTASHVTHGKTRELTVTTNDAYIMVDYQKQDVSIQRVGTEKFTSLVDRSGYRTETVRESPYITNREPLKNELEHFLFRVYDRNSPIVDGDDGVRAVALAEQIGNSVEPGCGLLTDELYPRGNK